VSMLRDPLNVDLSRWTPLHTRLIKLAASYLEVAYLCSSCDKAGSLRSSRQKQRVALESEAVAKLQNEPNFWI
jgi:murein endopeptidase